MKLTTIALTFLLCAFANANENAKLQIVKQAVPDTSEYCFDGAVACTVINQNSGMCYVYYKPRTDKKLIRLHTQFCQQEERKIMVSLYN